MWLIMVKFSSQDGERTHQMMLKNGQRTMKQHNTSVNVH